MANESPIAFFFTWSTFGTWLPGDQRGWVEYQKGFRSPDPLRELEVQARMTKDAICLDAEQREQVNLQVAETCLHKGWELFAVNCRSNHAHAVISASHTPKIMRAQLKAWCSQRLNNFERARNHVDLSPIDWWADRGSIRWVFGVDGLETTTLYVRDEQDNPRRFRQ